MGVHIMCIHIMGVHIMGGHIMGCSGEAVCFVPCNHGVAGLNLPQATA